jgi:predicted O-methyltransferase YrrM
MWLSRRITVLKRYFSESNINTPDFKDFNFYSPETCSYLKNVGLRPDPLRDNLEKETLATFGPEFEMMTQRYECELFESLIRFSGAKKCIEVGVFTGASSISIARGLGPEGRLLALDIDENFTNLAKKYWKIAGIEDKIQLVLGPAADYLQKLIDNGESGTYDFAFVDADKPNYDVYYEKLIQLIRKGGMIAVDNVLWSNRCADLTVNDIKTVSLRNISLKLQKDKRVKNFILPIADGINIVTKL